MNFYPIKHWFHSIKTISYWRYSMLSIDSFKTFFSAWGIIWLLIETAEYFKLSDAGAIKPYGLNFLIFAILLVIWTRRPLIKICYKLPGRDVKIEIRVADIFKVPGEIVISTNTTFDTDTSSGLISSNSLQGKFTKEFYDGNFQHLNEDLDRALATTASQPVTGPGKLKKYEIGSVAKITTKGRTFYLLAMADMNQHGNAQSSKLLIKQALKGLWDFIMQKGELGDVAIPLLGTGRGRVNATREETIKMIVTSFAQALQQRRFANKLTIVISPSDYREHELNLFELNDYLRAVHRYERSE
jgi:hypothetical protein